MYVINPSFLYFIVYCYNVFQNKFEIKIFENDSDILVAKHVEKTYFAVSNTARTGLI